MFLFLKYNKMVTNAFSVIIKNHNMSRYYFKSIERLFQIAFNNSTSGITVSLEIGLDAMWSIHLHKLVDGKIIHHPRGPHSEPVVYTYDMIDLLKVKNAPKDEIEIIKCYFPYKSKEIRASLRCLPGLVEKYAGDVLDGNFEIFTELLIFEKDKIKNKTWLSQNDIKTRIFCNI